MELEQKAKKQNEVLDKTRTEVNDVIDTMTDVVEKLDRRSEQLGMTSREIEKLEEGAKLFQTNTDALAKKMWWEDMKYKFALIAVGILILVLIIIVIILNTKSDD